jgi:hypothetical protein
MRKVRCMEGAMNETVLTLLSAIAFYALASLALPQSGNDIVNDPEDTVSEDVAGAPDSERAEDRDESPEAHRIPGHALTASLHCTLGHCAPQRTPYVGFRKLMIRQEGF